MHLTAEDRQELNILLKNTNLELPDFRRKVNKNGSNYVWLQNNILKRNPNISNRLKELLNI